MDVAIVLAVSTCVFTSPTITNRAYVAVRSSTSAKSTKNLSLTVSIDAECSWQTTSANDCIPLRTVSDNNSHDLHGRT